MSYNRIGTPRFYLDTNSWRMTRGFQNKITAYGVNYNTGSTLNDLIDMKPLNRCSFDTSANTDVPFLFVLNTSNTSSENKFDFVALLNHNLWTASGRILTMYSVESGEITDQDTNALIDNTQNFLTTVEVGDRVINTTAGTLSYVTAIVANDELTLSDDIFTEEEQDYLIFRHITPTAVVNATVDSDGGNTGTESCVEPPYNGSTIFTFDEITGADGQYWAVEIEPDSAFSATDLEIGCLMMGEYYDMPHSPDLSVKRDFEYDGVTLHQSLGGGEYSTATHFGGDDFDSNLFGQPFRNRTTTSFRRTGGRMSYDMKFSYLNDTNLMPSDLSSPWGDSVFHDVWNKTSGRFNPFIFAVDGTSTTTGDYIFARFNQDSFNATQVAPQVWDMSVKIRETW